jgi:phosphatidate cytidylyltransferase
VTTIQAQKKSDLGVRTASAFVMVLVAGTALWLGGWWWTIFVAAVGLGVLWEWWGLTNRIAGGWAGKLCWLICGIGYISIAAITLIALRSDPDSFVSDPHPLERLMMTLQVLLVVVAVDIGAYFTGRFFGGPKIAPKISPSKTWSGLAGGAVCAGAMTSLMVFARDRFFRGPAFMPDAVYGDQFEPISSIFVFSVFLGVAIAVIAQSGDFFESWMKRRAGLKDSGRLLPGHGGLFDRTDGLLAVLFVFGVMNLIVSGCITPGAVTL